MASRIIDKKQINQSKRPKLAAVMDKATCYLLDGELAKNKKQDAGGLTVLAEYGYSDRYEIITDEAASDGESEYFKVYKFSGRAWDAMLEIMLPKQPQRKESTGRPVKYGLKAVMKARQLHEDGLSIRKIAQEMGASTSTVQKLLK